MAEQNSGTGQSRYYIGIAAVVILILIALWLLLKPNIEPEAPPALPVASPEVAPAEVLPPMQPAEPVLPEATEQPVAEQETPLPSLDESDEEVKQQVLSLNWQTGLASLFVTEQMVRNLAVQIDNVAQGQIAAGHHVLQPLEESFSPTGKPAYQLDEKSFKRYERYIDLLESVPPEQILALYKRYEPLMQQAFAELGYPDKPAKQKLLQAIDVLLATPEVDYPLALEQPSVMYTFADPLLEQLPPAQKQMLRMGPENQKRLKTLLRSYRDYLLQN